jgi:hypothetical protein
LRWAWFHSIEIHAQMFNICCAVIQLCALRPPFLADTFPELKKNINMGRYPAIPRVFSPALSRVIGLLLQVNPRERTSAAAMLEIPDVASRLHLDDLAAEANVIQRQRSLHMMLMKTINIPNEISAIQLPKPCYTDVRPNSPGAWIVPDQERVAELLQQQPQPPQQQLHQVTYVAPSAMNNASAPTAAAPQVSTRAESTLAHRYLRYQHLQQRLNCIPTTQSISQKENVEVRKSDQNVINNVSHNPSIFAKPDPTKNPVVGGIAFSNNANNMNGPPVYSRHFVVPSSMVNVPSAPVKMPPQPFVPVAEDLSTQACNYQPPSVPCIITKDYALLSNVNNVRADHGSVFGAQPSLYRQQQQPSQPLLPPAQECQSQQQLIVGISALQVNPTVLSINVPIEAGPAPLVPVPLQAPNIQLAPSYAIPAPSAPSQPPQPHRRPLGPYVASRRVVVKYG